MKKILFFAVLLAAVYAGFTSCEKDNDEDLTNTVLENEYFAVQNGTVHKGTIPSSTSGISIANDININRNALAGGSSFVSINTEQQISEIYVGVRGVDYYYSIQPQNQTQSSPQDDLRAAVNTMNYSFVILFSQNFDETFDIQVSARLADGSLTLIYTTTISYIAAGTGSLQISLSFDNEKDVDLYVIQPDRRVIYYGDRGNRVYNEETGENEYLWGLDIDSNPNCDIDGINNENVFYPNQYIQSGKYEVWVNMYRNCNSSIPTNWIITALYEGALVSTSYGQNPEYGVFPINTPSNIIGSNLNSAAIKVMEFTLNINRSSSINRAHANNIVRSPLTESAKAKLANVVD